MNIDKLKDIIQDCNINFLFGSGMSAEYLNVLGSIETLLTDVNKVKDEKEHNIIRASLYKKYFDGVIVKNINILNEHLDTKSLMKNYQTFFEIFNKILLERKSTLLSKQINIFTTNIDICLEKAIEDKGYEYNDGFAGSFSPKFELSNFKKSLFKRSLHFENISEMPVFNIYKVHGSLTWKKDDSKIIFSSDLKQVEAIKSISINGKSLVNITDKSTIRILQRNASKCTYNKVELENYMTEYEKLNIVNPTKDKFKHTILNETYYELLRIYSNELEKDNSILFVLGFSFADEHIRDLTIRVANSNPTLIIYVFAYSNRTRDNLNTILVPSARHNNIKIISPDTDSISGVEKFKYGFSEINSKIFKPLERKVIEG